MLCSLLYCAHLRLTRVTWVPNESNGVIGRPALRPCKKAPCQKNCKQSAVLRYSTSTTIESKVKDIKGMCRAECWTIHDSMKVATNERRTYKTEKYGTAASDYVDPHVCASRRALTRSNKNVRQVPGIMDSKRGVAYPRMLLREV